METNLNSCVIVVFFHAKIILVKLRLNLRCHIDYFIDLLAAFLDLDLVRTLVVYGGSESCLMSLEQHEGE